MTADELLQTMRTALAQERQAIRDFDASAVARANEAKAHVLGRLHDAPTSRRPELYAALDELKPELRQNLVLLTHARAYLHEWAERSAASRPTSVTSTKVANEESSKASPSARLGTVVQISSVRRTG